MNFIEIKTPDGDAVVNCDKILFIEPIGSVGLKNVLSILHIQHGDKSKVVHSTQYVSEIYKKITQVKPNKKQSIDWDDIY